MQKITKERTFPKRFVKNFVIELKGIPRRFFFVHSVEEQFILLFIYLCCSFIRLINFIYKTYKPQLSSLIKAWPQE